LQLRLEASAAVCANSDGWWKAVVARWTSRARRAASASSVAGLWIGTASLPGSAPARMAGLVAAVWLFAYSLVSPFVGKVAIYPASIMVLVWLAVVAWQDGVRRAAA
jgi:hypothetical protein